MTVVLIGFKACGKTSVGSRLAAAIQYDFIDTDVLIEQAAHASVRDLYLHKGEAHFRAVEKSAIQSLQPSQPTVIATGGGVVLDQDNIRHLQTLGRIIYLYVSRETCHARFQTQPLPGFLAHESLLSVYDRRQLLYQQAADLELSTEDKSITEVVQAVIVACTAHEREVSDGI
ncbi:MAG: shikimate kinase [Gammaproteobacteria bacterium]|nr:shikimate kinase [Gammaproteobacteria bacterium]